MEPATAFVASRDSFKDTDIREIVGHCQNHIAAMRHTRPVSDRFARTARDAYFVPQRADVRTRAGREKVLWTRRMDLILRYLRVRWRWFRGADIVSQKDKGLHGAT